MYPSLHETRNADFGFISINSYAYSGEFDKRSILRAGKGVLELELHWPVPAKFEIWAAFSDMRAGCESHVVQIDYSRKSRREFRVSHACDVYVSSRLVVSSIGVYLCQCNLVARH